MNTFARTIVAGLCATLLASSALAANFSGSSHDITDFANGSEVSTAGTLIDAVNLLNDNVGGVGVSTTINGVLFKGTAPGQFLRGASRSPTHRSSITAEIHTPAPICGPRAEPTTRSPIRKSITSTTRT